MTLQPGTQLGPYEILAQIGAGGMGEVYSARDSNLKREVAIKVLPEQFASDSERLARFRREAQLLASLNHPHIATIHGLEESGGTHYLVMELVPGETLAERIKRDGTVPMEEALGIATQIAEALEHAHEHGIIHRDLKPANVKLTPEGQVKVLDFGLAKAFSADGSDSADTFNSNSPTVLTGSPTMPGVILGTAAYMSPEQAKGKAVDKRTDIWAFGCVLYELLTGQQVFTGESVPEILGGIFKSDPDWNALPGDIPPAIGTLLRRCLQKDAIRRSRDAAEIRFQIEEAQAAQKPAPGLIPARTDRRQAMPWAVGFIAGAIVVGLAVWNLMRTDASTRLTISRFSITLPPEHQLGFSDQGLIEPVVALSPDGSNLVYVANEKLYLRSMDSLEAITLSGTERAHYPFFLPDGQWVAFFADGKLKKVSIAGGSPLTLCDAVNPRGGGWGPEDTILFGQLGKGLSQVSQAGGTPEEVTIPDASKGEVSHQYEQHLPGRNVVLFAARKSPLGMSTLEVQSLETGERRVVLQGGTHGRYVSTGHLIYTQIGTVGPLMAVPFDLDRLEVTGAPVPVLEGIMQSTTSYRGQFSFSENGSLVYVPGGAEVSERTLVWVDRQGNDEPLAAAPRAYDDPRLSPDGQRVAVQITGGDADVWIYDIPRDTLTRLTFEGSNNVPLWTPDGERATFSSTRAGGAENLFWKAADGSGAAERLTTSEYVQYPASWSSDGQALVYSETRPTSGLDLWVLPLEGERKPQPFLQTSFNEGSAVFSPDGQWLAYTSNESGRFEIYVQPYPGPGGKWQISSGGGVEPIWPRNGRELFYRNGTQMMVVDISTEPTISAGTPRMLFQGRYYTNGLNGSRADYDVTSDGLRFLMIQEFGQEEAPTQINVVLNWFEELKERVPTGK